MQRIRRRLMLGVVCVAMVVSMLGWAAPALGGERAVTIVVNLVDASSGMSIPQATVWMAVYQNHRSWSQERHMQIPFYSPDGTQIMSASGGSLVTGATSPEIVRITAYAPGYGTWCSDWMPIHQNAGVITLTATLVPLN